MVEAILADLGKVIFSDPGVPVARQSSRCSVFAEGLSVGVLIDDGHARGPGLKDGGSDPWLEHEPATQVHATDFVILVVEGHITLAEAAVDWSVRLLRQGTWGNLQGERGRLHSTQQDGGKGREVEEGMAAQHGGYWSVLD